MAGGRRPAAGVGDAPAGRTPMILWRHELRLLLRQRLSAVALVLLALLGVAALATGMADVARQRTAIAAIAAAQTEDIGAVADYVDRSKDAGSAAYHSFHPTWDAPAPLAFAALGMRDVAPYILRVRALGLEAQIDAGDTFNPRSGCPAGSTSRSCWCSSHRYSRSFCSTTCDRASVRRGGSGRSTRCPAAAALVLGRQCRDAGRRLAGAGADRADARQCRDRPTDPGRTGCGDRAGATRDRQSRMGHPA
ncbi:hypothetical protein SPHINGO8AM_70094 [Sphingomonas sp. 8AM]|nr:hypothetical protein SPHINGO8AM_70094 [Sphingomonas sp. 8AM]